MRQVSAVSAVSAVTPSTRNRARREAVLPEPIIVSERWKNRGGESVRISLSTYQGRNLIDIRTWQHSTESKLVSGKDFAADARHVQHLTAAHTKAESTARGLDLISGDNDNGVVL